MCAEGAKIAIIPPCAHTRRPTRTPDARREPGGLGVIGIPHLDAGPFLSYGIQWISFGILAPIGVGYFIYSEIRVRRREKQAAAVEAPKTVEEKLADRYGRRR